MGTEEQDPLERRRDELRRIVFGTPGEPSEDVAAELAAVERELVDRDDVHDDTAAASDASAGWVDEEPSGAARGADDGDLPPAVAPAVDPDAARDEARPAGWRGRRLIIAAIAALVLIVAGIAVLGPVRALLSPPRGLDVFERPPTVEELELADQVAAAARLQPDDASTLRAVGRVFGYRFWAHRDGDQVCLLSQREYFFEWVRACTTVEEFRRSGLSRWISGDDIRDDARPARIRPEDLIEVTWGPRSIEVEWRVLPAS